MSLEDDKSIIIPEDDDYCAIKRGSQSILGRLLNPECQNMGRMLRTMPKIWKVYNRARGMALTRERFQFVFDLETDLQMVLDQGFWTFDDWGLAMERWVENPPPNYLQTAAIWIRLHYLPANYLTLKTIDTVADGVVHVKVIEFDPDKPLLNDYIRMLVVLDLNQSLRDKKSLTLPGGRVEYVEVRYERVRKKCFHCMRLSHEKPRCPVLQGERNKGKGLMGHKSQLPAQVTRQHHTDLAEKIMPLLAPSFPPGFEPHSSVIVPEVFEQMRLYMNCSDPDEKSIREAKMKKTLNELSKDPIAQRSCLRLEVAPKIVTVLSPIKGRVFDFSKVQEKQSTDVAESSSRSSANQSSRSEHTFNRTVPTADNLVGAREGTQVEAGVFVIGSVDNIGDRSNKSRNSFRSRSTWSRKNQNNRNKSASRQESDIHEREDGTGKRKADEDGEVSSKMSRKHSGLMVHQKPSNPQ
ncbi:uncharacterized protein LOC108858204 [Raphanus sativus]|uniref:Uncharacterized protein LOC108858204 n=1 Tax=Raphanus sativus TaxID=3726 RepID=A0A6J0NU65_RAPSA|nr:uncharacterized protein LOC108858204 [Raphanus sativus]